MSRVFLLSPAWCGGRRAAILMRPGSQLAIAQRLHGGTLTLGEAFAFMSGLYFRGKLTYAQRFGQPLVITPTRGLQDPSVPVSCDLLAEFGKVDLANGGRRFLVPLNRDLKGLAATLPADARVVLLGSIATGKYVDALSKALGGRLHFPPSFVGRGDMSRGGLLLRSAAAGVELDYAPLCETTVRHGARPAKLDPATRVQPIPAGR